MKVNTLVKSGDLVLLVSEISNKEWTVIQNVVMDKAVSNDTAFSLLKKMDSLELVEITYPQNSYYLLVLEISKDEWNILTDILTDVSTTNDIAFDILKEIDSLQLTKVVHH